MAVYKDFKLTNKGIDLFTELLQGSGEMEFRYLAAGSGRYAEGESSQEYIRGMGSLKEERQRVPFTSVKKMDGGMVSLKADLSNQGLTESYLMTEVGIYAGIAGSEESVLYCVTTPESPDYMPDFSSGRLYNVVFRTLVSIGDAEEITVVYTPDSYVSKEELQDALKSKVDSEVGKGLSQNDFTDEYKEAVDGLNGLGFGQDADGNWGYTVPDTMEIVPFGSGNGGTMKVKCGGDAIGAGTIIAGKEGEYGSLEPGKVFDITYPILYAASAIEAGAIGDDNFNNTVFSVTATQNVTLTAYKPVYIKGRISGILFTPDTAMLTQEVPVTYLDTFVYILLGTAVTEKEVLLAPNHPLYHYWYGGFSQYSPVSDRLDQFIKGMLLPMVGYFSDEIHAALKGAGLSLIYYIGGLLDADVELVRIDTSKHNCRKLLIVCGRGTPTYNAEPSNYGIWGNMENVLHIATRVLHRTETVFYLRPGVSGFEEVAFGITVVDSDAGSEYVIRAKTRLPSVYIWAEDIIS